MNTSTLSEQLTTLLDNLGYLVPEGIIAATLLLLVVVNAFRKGAPSQGYGVLCLLGTAVALASLAFGTTSHQGSSLFQGLIAADAHGQYVRWISLLGTFIAVVWSLADSKASYARKSEFYILLLGLTLGALLLGASTHFITIYLSLEALSLSAYLATHLREDARSAESSFKYLIFGAISSAFLLYSLSWAYGLTGSLRPFEPAFWEALSGVPVAGQVALAAGVTLGLAFKISAAPGHLWAPDVYETAPTPLVAFFSVVPKVAAATLLLRLGSLLSSQDLPALSSYWHQAWPLIIAITLLVGNFAALRQTRGMRLMAYSSIAHSGFLLLAVLPVSIGVVDPFRFYGLTYLLMNFATFGLIQHLHQSTDSDLIANWKGLGKHLPLPATLLLISLLSLIGLPPTAGFLAKLFTLSGGYELYQTGDSSLLAWVLGIGLFSTVVALFYYLKIPFFLFFKKSENFTANHSKLTYLEVFVFLLTIAILIGFFRPDLLLEALNDLLK